VQLVKPENLVDLWFMCFTLPYFDVVVVDSKMEKGCEK
jgi:hypothetical protein